MAGFPASRTDDDPFIAPTDVTSIAKLRSRERVAIRGRIICARTAQWSSGPVLEARIDDGTGSMELAFLGRHRIPGIESGCPLTAQGTVGRHAGRLVVLNPRIWLGDRVTPLLVAVPTSPVVRSHS